MLKLSHIFTLILALLIINSCATLPENFERAPSYALTDTGHTALGGAFAAEKAANPGLSGFHLLGHGLDALVARAALARLAERSLDVQYYLYHGDLVGHLLTNELIEAADHGVRVRMLLDDMDLAGRDVGVRVLDSHPNIEVRIFNPFSRKRGRISQLVTRMGSVTRRMHNKSFCADNQVAILGGRNIGDEYFNADPDMAFEDLDVMTVGPVVEAVSTAFDSYWNSDLAYPVSVLVKKTPTQEQIDMKRRQFETYIARQQTSVYLQALHQTDLVQKIRNNAVALKWGAAKLLYDQPEKIRHDFEQVQYHLAPQLKPYINGLRSELIIISPYFVPGKSGTALLTQLAQKGVRVRILTNSLISNDVGVVHAGYAKYRKALLRGGVELFELNKSPSRLSHSSVKGSRSPRKTSLHAKSFIFDRRQIFIGSLNLDPRAILHNTEIGVIFTAEALADELSDWFDQNIGRLTFRLELDKKNGLDSLRWHGFEDGQPITYTHEPYTGVLRRLGNWLLRLLPIETQL